jgi:ketosteroid isomerase-like protein
MAFSVPALAHKPTAKGAPQTTLPASVRGAAATVDAFHTALRRGDTRSAAALLADDALIFEEGGAERTKAEYAAHHLPADAEFSKLVTSTVTRRMGGANGALAWITSEGRMTGTYKGKALDRVTTETMVLRRRAGAWKVIHIHWSAAAKQ